MGMDHFGVKVGALLSSIAEKGLVSQNGHFSNFLNFQTLSGSRAKLRKVEKGKIIHKILLRVPLEFSEASLWTPTFFLFLNAFRRWSWS